MVVIFEMDMISRWIKKWEGILIDFGFILVLGGGLSLGDGLNLEEIKVDSRILEIVMMKNCRNFFWKRYWGMVWVIRLKISINCILNVNVWLWMNLKFVLISI